MAISLYRESFGDGPPLVVVHGLFGSADNWRTLAKAWAADAEHPHRVIAVDLRNHGRSPWSETMSYPEMAEDLVALLDELGLARAAVLGHSLGGKVAMTLGLAHPERVERLVVADIAPRAYTDVQDDVLAALRGLDPGRLASRGEADRRLAAAIPDTGTRQFLLKNLERAESGGYRFKLNLEAIAAGREELRREIAGAPVELPLLVLRGARSPYVRDEDVPGLRALFPRATVETVPAAGHWLHVDQPVLVVQLVSRFLADGA